MTSQPSGSIYAAFSTLPPASGQAKVADDAQPSSSALAAAAVQLPDLSDILEFAAKSQQRQQDTFDLARAIVKEHEEWRAAYESEEADREERRSIMRIAVNGERDKASGRSKAKKDQVTPRSKHKAISEVMQATGLEAERCRFFLELKEWKVQEAIASINDLGAASPKQDETTTLEFTMPGGKRSAELFKLSQFGFDIYAKAYQMLEKQDVPMKMFLSGPEILVEMQLDESTWSSSLSTLSLVAGKEYKVRVVQS